MMRRAIPACLLGAALAWSTLANAEAPAKAASAPAVDASVAPVPAAIASDTIEPAAAPAVAVPAPAVIQTRPDAVPAQPLAAASAGSLLQTILGLAFVLAMLALFAWGMKRFVPRQAAGAAGMRIVSALSLGGRERLLVVEVGDQWIVVGASPGRVNALATMPKQESAPATATLHPYAPSATSFAAWLKQTIDKRNAP